MAEKIPLGAYYLYRDGKSPNWIVRAECAPKMPLFKSTGTDNATLAKRKAKEIFQTWSIDSDEPDLGEQILFRDLWSRFIEDQAPFIKPQTKIRMESIGKNHLLPAFGGKFLVDIKPLWVQFIRTQRLKRPNSLLFNERKYLVAALTYAHENGYIETIPFIKAVEAKVKSKTFKIYSDKEIRRILEACDQVISTSSLPHEVRDYRELRLHILFGFGMGMRHDEICRIELADIDMKAKTLHIKDTKTKVDRRITINEIVMTDLAGQIERSRVRSEFLFPQVHNPMRRKDQRVFDEDWQALKHRLRITGRFHDLRHTCATKLAASNVPPEVAAAYLGMSLKVYDQTYCHLGTEQTKQASEVVTLPKTVDFAVESSPND